MDKTVDKRTEDALFRQIASIIDQAKKKVILTVNLAMVYTYYEIGRLIVQHEQQGKRRADYGQKLLQNLSVRLTERFGKGFSYPNLKRFRQFYQKYSENKASGSKVLSQSEASISSTVLSQSDKEKTSIVPAEMAPSGFTLSWSHYLLLMKIDDLNARSFYEIEAEREQWSLRELRRQVDSSLYERVALSKDKNKVMELSRKGQLVEKPDDILKEPYVLEFLGLKEDSSFSETELESRLIDHLQDFLLELGKGFAFIGRQVRFTFEEEHFFVDLVFYNRLLRCFVLFDLKTGKLKHQDIGQMQMYVHYYDRYVKQNFENPTIGILLCKEKNETIVKMTLPENENIYAAEYKLYLSQSSALQNNYIHYTIIFQKIQGGFLCF